MKIVIFDKLVEIDAHDFKSNAEMISPKEVLIHFDHIFIVFRVKELKMI